VVPPTGPSGQSEAVVFTVTWLASAFLNACLHLNDALDGTRGRHLDWLKVIGHVECRQSKPDRYSWRWQQTGQLSPDQVADDLARHAPCRDQAHSEQGEEEPREKGGGATGGERELV
jgi:hypothetical protein